MELLKKAIPIFPLVFLASVVLGEAHLVSFTNKYQDLIPHLPTIFFVISAILSIHYHNSNTFFISLFLGVSYLIWVDNFLLLEIARFELLQSSIILLVPLNLAFLAISRDKGIITPNGLSKSLILLGQFPLLLWGEHQYSEIIASLFAQQWIRLDWLNLPFSQSTLFIWMISMTILMISSIRQDNHLARAMIGSSIALAICLLNTQPAENAWVFFAAAAVITLLYQLQTSYRLAYLDQLTGLPGRRALELTLSRLSRRYTIAMLDIDHFKKFNDTYGHDVGDQVLKLVAGHVKNVGGSGKPARYGGEEFAIIFPRKSKQDCIEIVEQLRRRVENSEFLIRKSNRTVKNRGRGKSNPKRVSVTISIGLCEHSTRHKTTQLVMKGADQALYKAKKAGRNCTIA